VFRNVGKDLQIYSAFNIAEDRRCLPTTMHTIEDYSISYQTITATDCK